MTTARAPGLEIPELGPALGRLVAPPPPPPGTIPSWIVTEDLRLDLVSQLFDLAGDARRWAAEGDRELALATVNREAWLGAWQRAVDRVAERAAAAVSARLLAAAAEARVPRSRACRLPLDPEEVGALAARLQGGATDLDKALHILDQAAHHARSDRAPRAAVVEWQDALAAAARRLEAAWLALEAGLTREWREWSVEIEDLRAWRRPLWPLVAFGAVLIGGLGYAGLVLGGYLPVPGPLRGIAEAIWELWN